MRMREEEGGPWRTKRLRVGPSSRLRTKAAARLEADRLLDRMSLSRPLTGYAIAFDAFSAIYIRDHLAVMQRTTLPAYRSILNRHLVPILKSTPLHEITGRKPAAVVAALMKAGLSRSSIRATMSVLSRLLDVASELGYASVTLNRRSYRLPPRPPPAERRCFTPLEASKIIHGAKNPWKALYALMAYAGLRCSEALGLAWNQVDLQGRQLHIRQAAAMGELKTVKSRNSAADLPMPDELVDVLTDFGIWRAFRNISTELLFESPQGGPYWTASVYYHFTPLLKRLGIAPGGLHAFRHGHATNLFATGASAPVVRGMLRHGDIKTTLGYVHVTGEDMRLAAAAAGKRIGP